MYQTSLLVVEMAEAPLPNACITSSRHWISPPHTTGVLLIATILRMTRGATMPGRISITSGSAPVRCCFSMLTSAMLSRMK